MISLFRKIRKDGMKQNKVTRYLAYSIGEILLVLIGILIALEINNANERGKARAYEEKMLIEVKTALEQDLDFFENHLIGFRNREAAKAAAFFNQYYLTKQINKDSIRFHFRNLDFGFQISYNRGPYEALKSTGLDKVSNDSLRSVMIHVYDFVYPRWKGLIESQQIENAAIMQQLKGSMMKAQGYEVIDGEVVHAGPSLASIDQIDDDQFIRLVGLAEYEASSQRGRLSRLPPYMRKLIGMIETEVQ